MGKFGLHINFINASIGLNQNEALPILEQQIQETEALKNELNELKAYILKSDNALAKLVPGYKEEMGIEIKHDPVIASASTNIAMQSVATFQNSLNEIIDGYLQNRMQSDFPMDKANLMAKINGLEGGGALVDLEENLSMASIGDIEDFINGVLSRNYLQELKTEIPMLVDAAVSEIIDQVFVIRTEILDGIANGANMSDTERQQLEDKINEVVPIFGVLENLQGTLAQDAVNEICGALDDVLCEICSIINGLPGGIGQTILNANSFEIPPAFLIDVIDFFEGTYGTIKDIEIAWEENIDYGVGDVDVGFSFS
ncbi:MAG: hypothetical protein AAGK97_06175, partial [Bacteroidota bacterium]